MLLIVISCFKRFHLTRSRSLYLLLYCCREIIHELCGNTFSPLLIDGAQLTTRHVATVAKCDYNCPYLFRLILLDDEEEEELYDNLCDHADMVFHDCPFLSLQNGSPWYCQTSVKIASKWCCEWREPHSTLCYPQLHRTHASIQQKIDSIQWRYNWPSYYID